MSTKIEWTDFTWNPVRGCSMAPGSESGGCLNCYAARMAARFSGARPEPGPVVASWKKQPFYGFARRTANGARWTGRVELVESKLTEPLRRPSWRGKRAFVNSMSDLFHESLPDEAIDRVFAVMALSPDVTYQVVTKRAERMRRWSSSLDRLEAVALEMTEIEAGMGRTAESREAPHAHVRWPLPNVWLIVSVEDQPTADARIPHLLDTPAAVRGVSYEPALGPVKFNRIETRNGEVFIDALAGTACSVGGSWPCGKLDWIIAGGESGPGARPAHPDWFRSVRDQCAAAGVPFFFKQWGEWAPDPEGLYSELPDTRWGTIDRAGGFCYGGDNLIGDPGIVPMARVGKRAAGRLLDGCEHSEFPR